MDQIWMYRSNSKIYFLLYGPTSSLFGRKKSPSEVKFPWERHFWYVFTWLNISCATIHAHVPDRCVFGSVLKSQISNLKFVTKLSKVWIVLRGSCGVWFNHSLKLKRNSTAEPRMTKLKLERHDLKLFSHAWISWNFGAYAFHLIPFASCATEMFSRSSRNLKFASLDLISYFNPHDNSQRPVFHLAVPMYAADWNGRWLDHDTDYH